MAPSGGNNAAPTTPPLPVELSTIGAVRELLTRQLATGEIPRQQAALSVITELKLAGMGSAILPLLDSPDSGMQRRAIATLGAIRDPAANQRLLANLSPAQQPDEALIKVSIEALCGMQVNCYGQLRELLGYPSITVREALFNQLVAQWPSYRIMVVSDYHNPDGMNLQAQRSLLRILLAVDEKPTDGMMDDLRQYLSSADWGVRQDMIALWKKWSEKYYDDPELQPWFTSMTGIDRDISGMLESTSAPLPERLPAPAP